MTIREKREILACTIYKEDIEKGNLPAGCLYMTDSEVELYFNGLSVFLSSILFSKNRGNNEH